MRIAQLADIQVRYGDRHQEFEQVFQRTLSDLKQTKPDRIAILGDIFHHKVKLSPNSIMLVANFFFDLSDIAPTDVILGNHDLNLKQLEQGDAITPIFHIAQRLGKLDKAITISKDNSGDVDFWKNSVYYYPDSGLYDLSRNLMYGVFSCKDNIMVKIEDKDPDKLYVALWHGTLYGSKMDNGHDAKGDELVNKSTFYGFDVVMMGDIHEQQYFERDHEIEVDDKEVTKYLKAGWERSN